MKRTSSPGRCRSSGSPRSFAFALGCLLCSAIPVRGQSLDELLHDLEGADAARRAIAVEKLAEAGAVAAPRVARIASSASTDEVRLAALEALAGNSMAYAYSHVFWDALPPGDAAVDEKTDHQAARTRRIAWDCLIRVGDSFIAVGEFGAASDHYGDLLEGAVSARERASAIRGLGRASRRRAAELVFAALGDDDAFVRRAAIDAVAELRWGQARPHLEKVLNGAKASRKVDLLEALSRRREPDAAAIVERCVEDEEPTVRAAARRARSRHHGLVTEWLAIGPITESDGVLDTVRLGDEGTDARARPREGAAVEIGERVLRWKTILATGSNGAIDTRPVLGRDASDSACAYTEIAIDKATRARLRLTCGGTVSCRLNGKEIDLARGDAKSATAVVELGAGTNRILLHIRGEGGRPGIFCLRLTDEEGAPLVCAPPPIEAPPPVNASSP